MNNKGSSLEFSIKFQYFSVILKKLFFRVDFSSSQLFLKIFFHLCIFLRHPFICFDSSPLIILILFSWSLRLPNFLIKFPCIIITIINIDNSSIKSQRFSNSDIISSKKFAIIFHIFFSF